MPANSVDRELNETLDKILLEIRGNSYYRMAYPKSTDKIKASLKAWALRERARELDYIIGWCDRNGEPQFDVNGLKTRKMEIESQIESGNTWTKYIIMI